MYNFVVAILLLCTLTLNSQVEMKLHFPDSADVLGYPDKENPGDSLFGVLIDFENQKYRNDSTTVLIYSGRGFEKRRTQIITTGDVVLTRHYHRNGQLKKLTIETKPNFGLQYVERYYDNGQLKVKINFHRDEIQLLTYYWPNGQIKEQFKYFRGIVLGDYKKWNENGQLVVEGQYKEETSDKTSITWLKSIKTGTWIFWDDQGDIERRIVYKNGEVLEEVEK